MPQLTEWLKLMVSEINRKREDAERAQQEEVQREKEVIPPLQQRQAETQR